MATLPKQQFAQSTNALDNPVPSKQISHDYCDEDDYDDEDDSWFHELSNKNSSSPSLTPSRRTKLEQFRRLFRDTPVNTDRLLVDYSCALLKNNNSLLLQGRMYITESWVCFYSKILYEQKIFLSVKEIVSITREKTARFIPNAIQIIHSNRLERFFFTSFTSRDRTFAILQKVWENKRVNQKNSQVMNLEDIFVQLREICESASPLIQNGEGINPELVSNQLQESSDSSISSRLTGTGNSKTESLDDNGWRYRLDSESKHEGSLPNMCAEMSDQNLMSLSADCNLINSNKPTVLAHTSSFPYSNHPLCSQLPLPNLTDENGDCSGGNIGINHGGDNNNVIAISSNNNKHENLENDKTTRKGKTTDGSKFVRDKKKRSRKRSLLNDSTNLLDSKSLSSEQFRECNDGPPACCSPNHDHIGRSYADADIMLSVDALFKCIFTDSAFFKTLCDMRGTFDMVQSDWPEVCSWGGQSCPNMQRTITYTLNLKNKIGPRTCPAIEQQTLSVRDSEPGKRYLVDAKVNNEAIPLCNSFCVTSRYCLLRVNRYTSHLKVTSQIIYEKPMFFGTKSIIENSCRSGLTDFFDALSTQLNEYASQLTQPERVTGGWMTKKSTFTHSMPEGGKSGRCPISKLASDQSVCSKVDNKHHLSTNHRKTSVKYGAVDPGTNYKTQCSKTEQNNKTGSKFVDFSISPTIRQSENSTTNFLFGAGDITYLFLRPDRAWLLLVIISLLLCLCLSLVYNRLLALEKLAEQFSANRIHCQGHDNDQSHQCYYQAVLDNYNNNNPVIIGGGSGGGGHSTFQSSSSSTGAGDRGVEFQKTKIYLMKELTVTLSKTLETMKQVLSEVHNAIDVLDFPHGVNNMFKKSTNPSASENE